MKTRALLTTAAIGMLFLTSACDAADQAPAAEPTSRLAAYDLPADTEATAAPETAPSAAAATATPAGPPLADYIGKYPFNKVDGIAWNDHPLVKAGVEKSVTDAKVREAMATISGPSAPIAMQGDKVAAWSCQQHRCGEHSWAVMVDPASGATDVCYMNDTALANQSRWFLANGTQENRDSDCSLKE